MSFGFFGGPGIADAGALRGKKIGISTLRSESDIAATLALQKLGLKRDEVQVVETGTTLERLEALSRGEIAAAPLNEPVNIMAAQRGLPMLIDLADDTPWILNGIVVDRGYLNAHRDTVLEFLRAYTEAIHFALSDGPRTEAILTARFGALAPGIAHATYEDFKRRVPRDAAPSTAAAENMLRQLPALGTRLASRRVADYVDTSLIDALAREGYFGRLTAKYPTVRP
jgi:ABC-type nitrate/sulfonate/bicarbonate transport system substrate-binding protein